MSAPHAGSLRARLGGPLSACALYALLIVVGSLFPWSEWRAAELLAWVHGAPRRWTAFDNIANALAYMPLGALAALSLAALHVRARALAWLGASLVCAALSFAMESLQTMLPARVASLYDFITNSIGGALGAAMILWAGGFAWVQWLIAWRHRIFEPGGVGLTLLVAWLFFQLNPAVPFFEAGTTVSNLNSAWNARYTDTIFALPQMVGIALSACGFGLFVTTLVKRGGLYAFALAVGVMALGAALKSFGAAVLLRDMQGTHEFTVNTVWGVLVGLAGVLLLMRLTALQRVFFAAMLILAGGLMSKLASVYLSFESTLRLLYWPHGHLSTFAIVTSGLAETWGLFAFAYLIARFLRSTRAQT